ncbi:capsular polysaccharide export protein [Bisgaardia hudsonensis]|uniref:Capsular polysaccharide export protein n=1 Tax=Bisgaardia hudsonensis TaxID=109472 RepID=A0A4R2N2Y1_9PAST|nr:capsule biosynthesis protein [Bisgaardia hudsonensis]QLB12713.1 capsule biosynthesis protein [Bisgaardia hudsonensis]TCP14263.1 capsular polysaccharide export protein [Bisgaardia hudsonensis]
MILHNLDDLLRSSKNILLLQGPIGDFFLKLSEWLTDQGKTVFKINFNGGDEFFYPIEIKNTYCYQDKFLHWEEYLKIFLIKLNIDSIVCFGDTRYYHKIAKIIAENKNINFWVFEEGYFRPEYVTLEKKGVNAFSIIPKYKEFFLPFIDLPEPKEPEKVAKGFWPMAKRAILYYWAMNTNKANYPYYIHHRHQSNKYYVNLWIRSAIKRLYYYFCDYFLAHILKKGKFGEFFIVPLQVYDDSQVKVHCDYSSVSDFLEHVLVSFIKNSPNNVKLIIKHHPMDRGIIDYSSIIKKYLKLYPQFKERIYYIHDIPLPILLRNGKGMVCLNSTSGISALLHNMPVKTLGRANYDFLGLTDQGQLDNFWKNPQKPDADVFNAFRKYHFYKTHLNGSFYNKVILRNPYNQI